MCVRCSAGTDNIGNSYAVARLLSTSFPLNAFLMELALRLQREGAEFARVLATQAVER